ncbi:hypothetical protein GCM10022251_81190 [Phytohabitans flavus]|uniref:Uncharacterized protein n=1 Tax=Phytohabitans flavus TaxID=1076124 RepID=A0A6F8XL52_9ACTN|nr:hypothetical protein Pflav_009520 [Phytohabitans flavus]
MAMYSRLQLSSASRLQRRGGGPTLADTSAPTDHTIRAEELSEAPVDRPIATGGIISEPGDAAFRKRPTRRFRFKTRLADQAIRQGIHRPTYVDTHGVFARRPRRFS